MVFEVVNIFHRTHFLLIFVLIFLSKIPKEVIGRESRGIFDVSPTRLVTTAGWLKEDL